MHMTNQDGNYMTKQWPKSDLLLSLGFPKPARNRLCRWYWEKQDTVTLAEVFELVISSEKDPRPGYLISKMLDIRCVGKKSFLSVVSSMARLDYGKQYNLIWESKYTQFLNDSRGKNVNRSKPIFCILIRFGMRGLMMPKKSIEQMIRRRRKDNDSMA